MHRVLLNAPKGLQVDHINHDTLDNRKENLRLVTADQNNCNLRTRSGSLSGFKGVSFHKRIGKFQARIQLAGREIYLGYFTNAEEASEVYKKAAVKYHGEFACLG